MLKFRQGLYRVKNIRKYKGNASNCVFRSTWEHEMMIWLDAHPQVLEWASEEHWFCIPYRHPFKGVIARYFPDFYVKRTNKEGKTEELLIEVKPEKETNAPPSVRGKNASKRLLYAQMTYAINQAKFEAATKYCEARGWRFVIITEKQLNFIRG